MNHQRLLVASAIVGAMCGTVCGSWERTSYAASPAAQPVSKTVTKKVYVHLMPWFEDPSTGNGTWGQHWTMTNQNPNIVDGTGRRQIASYYYPLIGPYGSSDHDVIEYQLLLMKYSGIDGVLIDWPGTIQAWDYPKNLQNAEAIIGMTPQMGLEFGIVYEDHNVALAYNAKLIGDEIGAAKSDMAYARDNYFGKPNYSKINGLPLLLDFGPQTFSMSSQWDQIFSVFSTRPTFLTLWWESNQAGADAQGEFTWVASDFTMGLSHFYMTSSVPVRMGCAYPGYNSFYAAGGWGTSSWTVPSNGTSAFSATLNMAIANVDTIQLVTWNDYGEGTMIEPTREFNYDLLTTLQKALGVPYGQTELELIATLFQERKQYAGDAGKQGQLDQASNDLANLQVSAAASILGPLNSGSGGGSGGSSGGSGGGGSTGSGGSSGVSSGGTGPGQDGGANGARDGGAGNGANADNTNWAGACSCQTVGARTQGGAWVATSGCVVLVLRRRRRQRAARQVPTGA